MATAGVALKKMREICLGMPDTDEKVSWGKPHFRVGGKIFASCGEEKGACRIVVQLEPDHADALVGGDARFERYPRAADCVMIDVARVKSWGEIRELVEESYRLQTERRRRRR